MRGPVTLHASGFVSLEGPVVDALGDLYVADLRAGGVFCVHPDGTHDLVVPDRRGVGGISLHAAGGLVVSGPTVAHIRGDDAAVLLRLDELEVRVGTFATGFNDLAVDSHGRVLAGVLRQDADGRPVPGELVRIDAPHEHEVIFTDVHPNGVAFSAADDRLYLADTFRRQLIVFDSTGDLPIAVGTIPTDAVPGLPDGVATDIAGGIWVAMYRGACVARFTEGADEAAVIEMPVSKPLSLCFGSAEPTDLYVVTGRSEPGAADTGSIFRLSSEQPGTRLHVASI
jgi:sugar lactone lactonase YvrE